MYGSGWIVGCGRTRGRCEVWARVCGVRGAVVEWGGRGGWWGGGGGGGGGGGWVFFFKQKTAYEI